MPPTVIRSPPDLDSFVSLEHHQSQTPASFFSTTPVLYHHVAGAIALASNDQISKLPIFRSEEAALHGGATSRESSMSEQERLGQGPGNRIETVDVFVSSESFTIFNNAQSTGVSIPYPAISLHAIQRLPDQIGLYMQIELEPESSLNDEEPETTELTIMPSVSNQDLDSVQVLFDAVSACSNLHPDPVSQEDEDMLDEDGDSRVLFEGDVGYEGISGLPGAMRGASDGGLPPPFPGSGGWITAENVLEYFDEEGNWLGSGEYQVEILGEGAGRVRSRDEIEAADGTSNGATRVNGRRPDEDKKKRIA